MGKIRVKDGNLVKADNDRWYLAEKAKRNGNQVTVSGWVYDVTESVEPSIAGNNSYIRRLEAALVNKIRECMILNGLTPDDDSILKELERLREKVK